MSTSFWNQVDRPLQQHANNGVQVRQDKLEPIVDEGKVRRIKEESVVSKKGTSTRPGSEEKSVCHVCALLDGSL